MAKGLLNRWMDKVLVGDECWEWLASTKEGYGVIWNEGRYTKAHRLAYAFFTGPLAADLFVCHTCDNPRCVKPSHLFLGTNQDNIADRGHKGRTRVGTGERHGNARLSDAQVDEIRCRYRSGERQTALAAWYGVSQAHISRIVLAQSRTTSRRK